MGPTSPSTRRVFRVGTEDPLGFALGSSGLCNALSNIFLDRHSPEKSPLLKVGCGNSQHSVVTWSAADGLHGREAVSRDGAHVSSWAGGACGTTSGISVPL